jgi:putative PEP-CTERM system TPR-repeat lipoprotein
MAVWRRLGSFLLFALLALHSVAAGATDYVAQARELRAKGDLRAAEIELKNAVRADAGDMVAHYELARVELDLGNASAAEYEARAAKLGGYDLDLTVPLLAETYLAQHKYAELLRDFDATGGSPAERAGVLVARGRAQIALGKADDGLGSLDQARGLAPDLSGPLLAKANYLISRRDFAAAEPLVEKAVVLTPKDNEVRLAKVQLLRVKGKSQEAVALLGEILAAAPSYLPAHLARAEMLLSQSEDTAAKADIDAVLAIQPHSVAAVYLTAFLDAKGKDFQGANTELQKLSGVIASIPRGYYLQAIVQLNLQQLVQAEDSAHRFSARNPDDLAGQKLVGTIELALGRPDEAVAALEKFQTAGNADAGALDILGKAYVQLGRTADAVEAFSGAVKLAPQNPALQLRLGASELRSGNSTEGLSNIEQSLELAPSASAAEILVANDLSAGRWQEARSTVDKLRAAQPESPVPGDLDGLSKIAQFDLDGARADFAKLVEAHPDYLPAKLNLARVLELQGNISLAEETLSGALAKKTTAGVVLAQLVPLLLSEGKVEAAITAVERAHNASPDDRGITGGLIALYIRLGQKDKALTLAKEEPGSNDLVNVPLITARAEAEVAAGLNSDAVKTYRRAIEIVPTRIDLRRALAKTLVSTGDLSSAREAINQAIAVSPHNAQLAADLIALDLKISGVTAALATAHQLQTNDRELPTAAALEGDVYMAAHEYTSAVDAFIKALHETPSAMLALRLSQAQLAAGNADGAIDTLQAWTKDHPADITIAEALANDQLAQHKFDAATTHLEQVVGEAGSHPIALNNLAWLYQRVGDPRAAALAERAYFLAPKLPQVADTLGWILVQQGKAASAVELLKDASAKDPPNLEIQYHLAVALSDSGEREKAMELLKTLTGDKATFDDKPSAEKLFAELSRQ